MRLTRRDFVVALAALAAGSTLIPAPADATTFSITTTGINTYGYNHLMIGDEVVRIERVGRDGKRILVTRGTAR